MLGCLVLAPGGEVIRSYSADTRVCAPTRGETRQDSLDPGGSASSSVFFGPPDPCHYRSVYFIRNSEAKWGSVYYSNSPRRRACFA